MIDWKLENKMSEKALKMSALIHIIEGFPGMWNFWC